VSWGWLGWLAPLALLALGGCGGTAEGAAAFSSFNPGPTPEALRRGERIFNTYCMSCHGRHGTGEGLGPPLLDTLYAPGRMPDEAIYIAVERGVNQNHWHYGAMPKNPRIGRAEVSEIIPYIRWIQQRAGLVDSGAAAGGR
jgi:mono/diheme cytochrome c family protein